MSEPLLERYRAALASGHVALRTGRLEEAASAYREAIELGPDRAVPRRSLGVVCLRLGEPVAALTAFDGALELAPGDDEATLGRAQALVVLRRPAEAAGAYDELADIRSAAGRPADACDALRRALEIEPSAARRQRYVDLIAELRAALGDAEAELALERARAVLAVAAAVSRPPDGEALVARSEAAADRADIPAALEAAMAAARAHRAAGCHVAAIDALLRAQPLAPDDRELHLLLAELQADQGWTAVAAEKLRHLARLAELEGEPEAAARILGTGWSGGPAAALAEPGPG